MLDNTAQSSFNFISNHGFFGNFIGNNKGETVDCLAAPVYFKTKIAASKILASIINPGNIPAF